MNAEFYAALDLIEKEKGIPKAYMIAKIEAALAKACQKEVGLSTIIRVQLDPVKNDFRVFQQRTVVPDGDVYDKYNQISLRKAGDLLHDIHTRDTGCSKTGCRRMELA